MGALQQRGSVAVIVLAAAGAVVALVTVAWTQFGWNGEPRPWNKPAQVDEAVVRLTYVDSPCQDSATVAVDENAERVVLTVRTRTFALSCSEALWQYKIEARLDSPLGARRLIDGACQLPEFASDPNCTSAKPTN